MQAVATDIEMLDNSAAAVPNLVVRIGGAALGVAGFFVAATGAQLLVMVDGSLLMDLVGALQLLLGLAAVGTAPMIMKGRAWAAILGTPLALVTMLTLTGWNIYALVVFLISPVAWLAALFAMLAALLVPATVPGAIKASRARNALYQ